ncbi:WD40-repeat-containing domain protein [Pseudomassariella vexata]|uniref:WD40-repeat-containing domain protein n=1 Tax=Pseudomassariella vexata TaxID=1141098 RepID=A0A1Y2E7L4_9PEZI|nr:WD40-repeat-containing domain protein [Pseudomassariella vexata]ORY67551.1 WD40-repeat-containing domain protein [Pseudomassariella vexata]
MADVDDAEEVEDEQQDHDDEENDNDNDDDDDDDQENENDEEDENNTQQSSAPKLTRTSATPAPIFDGSKWQLKVRPEVLTATSYDIVPTMAAPMATSVNAMSITPDLRYWMTGGSDGYIRKYDGPGTINGKTPLTVAQRHPFVESVTKAGILMSYWENAEPQPASTRAEDIVLSPVYSLAVNSSALWLLSGLESGGINIQSVRHDEGKRITCLQKHTNAVSVLTLSADEKSVLSGSWDKNIFDWDLNVGQVKRTFDGSGGQISALETRPMGGVLVPPEASVEELPSDTFFGNNGAPINGDFDFSLKSEANIGGNGGGNGADGAINGVLGHDDNGLADAQGSPAHDSLFGGSPAGSDLFGDNFGGEDDNEFSRAMMQDANAQEAQEAQEAQQAQQAQQTQVAPGENTMSDFDMTVSAGLDDLSRSMNSGIDNVPLDGTTDTQMTDFSQTMTTQPETTQPEVQTPSAFLHPESPSAAFVEAPTTHYDTTQTSNSTFLSASIDGPLRIWDRRAPNPIARIGNRHNVPPWCMGACWSHDGNWIYVGRRNGTIEEFSVAKARGGRGGWQPERTFKFPNGSGPVSCVRPMVNGRHLVCASHDILRLYDLRSDEKGTKHAPPPFLIVPGPPRAGVISSLYIDASSRFMLSAAGTRGWEGTSTEVLIGYEIGVPTNR